jgi:hypothetical protein
LLQCNVASICKRPVKGGTADELAYTRLLLDSRYDDLKNGKVKLIGGDEVKARLLAKSAARRFTRVSAENS